jgi:hypothetical protein
VIRVLEDVTIPANSASGSLSVACGSGEFAISGGFFSNTGFAYSDHIAPSASGWIVLIDNFGLSVGQGDGYVVCVRP